MQKEQPFGLWLKRRRRELDLTQEALAEQAGYSAETIKKIENGSLRPSQLLAGKLAEIFEIPAEEQAAFVRRARQREEIKETSRAVPTIHSPLNLPVLPNALIGREGERAAAAELLRQAGVRLVTFSGPGGTGKTSLAIQVANDLAKFFGGGVYFVGLVSLQDPALVLPTIAETLGLQVEDSATLETSLQNFLRDREGLLVLDNFEHLLPAAPQIAALLEHTFAPKILVTSRASLNLRWEKEFAVPSLALPEANLLALAALEKVPAIRLFLERARASRPGFGLTEKNMEVIVEICRRLDGLPLALELAAARIKVLQPAALLARLDRSLTLLTGGPADLPARQQTLRSAIAWSYDLLGELEKKIFRGLGVFAGGCALEAAEEVFAAECAEAGVEILDVLSALTNQSLLKQRDEGDTLRYYLLETLREYALEQLEQVGELDSLCNRHLEWCTGLAERYTQALRGAEVSAWREQLEREQANLRAALSWGLDAAGAKLVALRLVAALRHYWEEHSLESEGRKWCEKALALPESLNLPVLRAAILHGAAQLAHSQADIASAQNYLRESVALYRKLDDPKALSWVLITLGSIQTEQGEIEQARASQQESLELARKIGDKWLEAWALYELGVLVSRSGQRELSTTHFEEALTLIRQQANPQSVSVMLYAIGNAYSIQGDYVTARRYIEEALTISRKANDWREITGALYVLGYAAYRHRDYVTAEKMFGETIELANNRVGPIWLAWITNHLGDIKRAQGKDDEAEIFYRQSLDVFESFGETQGVGALHHNLGYLAQHRKDVKAARAEFEAAFNAFYQINNLWCIGDSLIGLAGIKLLEEKPEEATNLLGAAEKLHRLVDSTGGLLDPAQRDELDKITTALKTRLGEITFQAQFRAGQELDLDQIKAMALNNA